MVDFMLHSYREFYVRGCGEIGIHACLRSKCRKA